MSLRFNTKTSKFLLEGKKTRPIINDGCCQHQLVERSFIRIEIYQVDGIQKLIHDHLCWRICKNELGVDKEDNVLEI